MNLVPDTSIELLNELIKKKTSPRWQDFIELYRPMLQAFLTKYFPLLDPDDIIQETFIAIGSVLPHYRYDPDEKGYFHNFLTGILYHKALSELRAQRRRQEVRRKYARETGNQETPGEIIEKEWRRSIYEIALQQFLQDENISDRNKQILIRTAINGEKPEEIAESMAITRNIVDQTKKRMMEKLRILIGNLKNADKI